MKLRDQAYESFRQRLLSLDLRPGQFVSQRELVAITGMPLGAIRELVPRLEADGLIVTVPQRGMQIANVDVKLVRNAFQLRAILEREAIAQFAARAADAEVERLVAAHGAIAAEAKRGLSEALLERAQAVDWDFHDTLIDALGNDLVSGVYRVNSIKIRLIRLERVLLSPESLLPALDEHAEILAAIRRRDASGAVAALDRHLTSARNRAMGISLAEPAPPTRAPQARIPARRESRSR
ncbi:MAG: GntR family transcriptional regulator [Alphaproteobacteria bacterium]|nr:GntR family transcriptional regulator [Alphaproteobacteria bacterium]